MMQFLPALCSVTFRQLPVEDVVRLAADAGLAAIEWAGDAHVPPGDLDAARLARTLTERAGLAVCSYGSYIAPPDSGPGDFEAALTTTMALGARHIRIWPGSRNRASNSYSMAETESLIAMLSAMGRHAAKQGITVGLEFHPGSLTDTTASAVQTIAALRSSNVYLYWQPRPGLPLDEARQEIAQLGDDICHLHVFAWDGTARRYPLAAQADYWRVVLASLPQSRFDKLRYAMLEFVEGDAPGQLRADAATLLDILETGTKH